MPEQSNIVVRKALLGDVARLVDLINGYASQGIMLPRTEFELAENVRDFTVAVHGEEVIGGGALHFYGTSTGEVRSLAVHPDWQSHGVGRRLVEALESEALLHGLRSLFAFTYVASFFAKLGFEEVDRGLLPSKVWKDCLRCPKLQCCDEIAMRKLLGPVEDEGVPEEQANGFVVFPTLSLAGGSG
jgi:amino-acid N-acetyltransferase